MIARARVVRRAVAGGDPHAVVGLVHGAHRLAEPDVEVGGHPLADPPRPAVDAVLLGAAVDGHQRVHVGAGAGVEQRVQQREVGEVGGEDRLAVELEVGPALGGAQVALHPAAERLAVERARRPVVSHGAVEIDPPGEPGEAERALREVGDRERVEPRDRALACRPAGRCGRTSEKTMSPSLYVGIVVSPSSAISSYIRSWVGPTHCPPSSIHCPSDSAPASVRPPTRSRASTTTTDRPAPAIRRAAASPDSPAPTTTTSSCSIGHACTALRSKPAQRRRSHAGRVSRRVACCDRRPPALADVVACARARSVSGRVGHPVALRAASRSAAITASARGPVAQRRAGAAARAATTATGRRAGCRRPRSGRRLVERIGPTRSGTNSDERRVGGAGRPVDPGAEVADPRRHRLAGGEQPAGVHVRPGHRAVDRRPPRPARRCRCRAGSRIASQDAVRRRAARLR